MKKQLSLLAFLALSTSVVSAATLNLSSVFDEEHDFWYTENQNITVDGFQTKEDKVRVEFKLVTPILKDSKDVTVWEYYVLLWEQPMSNYLEGDAAAILRDDLVELPVFQTMDYEGSFDITIQESQVNSWNYYYGVVVPMDDNVNIWNYSKEFCFNFSSKKYAEGEACASFKAKEVKEEKTPETTTKISALEEELSIDENEHEAAGWDMSMADISHSINGNKVTLTWTEVPYSSNVEVRLFNKQTADYETLGTVPMSQKKFDYTIKQGDSELIFMLIPRDAKGKEYRYPVNVRYEEDWQTPVIKAVPATGPVEDILLIAGITAVLYLGYRVFRRADS